MVHRLTLAALSIGAVAVITATTQTAGAQAPAAATAAAYARNAVYLELLGSGGLFSINYERVVGNRLALRLGAGTWAGDDAFGGGETSVTTVPITISALRGGTQHHLEAGGGILLGSKSFESAFGEPARNSSIFALSGLIGYRYQRPGSGLLFRTTFTPLLGLGSGEDVYPDKGITPSAGVSVGWGF